MEEFIAYLTDIGPVSADLLQYLLTAMTLHSYKKNEFLARNGQVQHHFFFIVNGLVRYYEENDHSQVNKWFFRKGDIIQPTPSCPKHEASKESLIAFRPTVALSLPTRALEEIYLRFPAFEHHGRIMTERYNRLWFCILDGIRLKSAAQREQFLREEFPALVNAVAMRHLASCIDLNFYTVIKARARTSKSKKKW